MRAWSIGMSLVAVTTLVACGGGGSSAGIAQAPGSPDDAAPAPDPTASWPVKPLLGTWTGTYASSGCGDRAAQGAQTLVISSTDGVSYTVKATPGIAYPSNLPFRPGTDETSLTWTGEPTFTVSKQDPRWNYYWNFKLVAPGQAEVFSQ